MFATSTLRRTWRSLWALRAPADVALLSRVLLVSLLAAGLALALLTLVAVFGTVDSPGWQSRSVLPLTGFCLCVLYGLFGALWLAGRLLPAPLVERMAAGRDARAEAMLAALAALGAVLGLALGFVLVPRLASFDIGALFQSVPLAFAKIALFLLVVMAVNWRFWRARLRRQQLQSEALDARLRLLQGQIEPHLLFNTLANVQSLMDHDPARAKRMLEAFSDYLRAGLTQLRQTETTLGAELATAESYLALLQIRMEERLRFRMEASDEARAAALPTLVLQPLVENAIHHGLEPKVEGGSILISCHVRAGRLQVRVRDDGMGLSAPSRRLRPGAGMALANLHTRLRTRYGTAASLTLQPGPHGGTEAVLDLPLEQSA